MDERPVWERIIEAAQERSPHPLTWLSEQLGYTLQRVQNWSVRGVPAREYRALAQVFGESLEWVIGTAPRRRDQPKLSQAAIKLAEFFDAATEEERRMLARLLPADIDLTAIDDLPRYHGGLSGFGDLDDEQDEK